MQIVLNSSCHRVRTTEHAPPDPRRVLERRHGLANIEERGAGVQVERRSVAASATLASSAPRPRDAVAGTGWYQGRTSLSHGRLRCRHCPFLCLGRLDRSRPSRARALKLVLTINTFSTLTSPARTSARRGTASPACPRVPSVIRRARSAHRAWRAPPDASPISAGCPRPSVLSTP